ncbi:GNAT family N-acetyltransferase [Helcococcus sueciensis]|uniref:GNAT family N-acetyltransferase n=1 Tax=Helcococcus sueciensis TaxID=241555 RepID=UPI000417143B|nr:GNAT family N-acetyltransferase [Helcococcus sueciensis]
MSYRLEPLVREDAKLLKSWDEFSDPIFYGYNYNNLNENQEEIWFLMKQKKYRSSYFSIKDEEGNLLGFIGLKEINNILNTAKLGIVIAPSFVSNGLGTSVMEEFIAMCFDEFKFRKINLEVNEWNTRAINLYKRFNFKEYKYDYQEFENQLLDLNDERYEDIRDSFIIEDGVIYSKVIHMSLNRQEYRNESRTRKK